MKLNALIGVMTVAVFFVACAPKDEKYIRSNSNQVNQANMKSMSESEKSQFLALTLDRPVEALVLMRSALDDKYAAAHNLMTVSGTLVSIDGKQKFSSRDKAFTSSLNYTIQALEKNSNDQLVKVQLISSTQGQLPMQIGYLKGADSVSKIRSQGLSISKTTVEGIYQLSTYRDEDLSSKKDKNTKLISAITATFEWDGKLASLDAAIAFKSLSLNVTRSGTKGAVLVYEDLKPSLSVKINQASAIENQTCVSLDGQLGLVQLLTGETAGVIIKDSAIEMTDGSFKMDAEPCESRPVVDLTKIL